MAGRDFRDLDRIVDVGDHRYTSLRIRDQSHIALASVATAGGMIRQKAVARPPTVQQLVCRIERNTDLSMDKTAAIRPRHHAGDRIGERIPLVFRIVVESDADPLTAFVVGRERGDAESNLTRSTRRFRGR